MPWEYKNGDMDVMYASNLATPLEIEVEASNGASDYGFIQVTMFFLDVISISLYKGNKYGEPVIAGFTRSFGQTLPSGERVEWIKPVMFTAGIGLLDARHSSKGEPEVGMIVCKIGGPAYRIGRSSILHIHFFLIRQDGGFFKTWVSSMRFSFRDGWRSCE